MKGNMYLRDSYQKAVYPFIISLGGNEIHCNLNTSSVILVL